MKKVKASNGREFWISDSSSDSVDGLPVFSSKEVSLIKQHKEFESREWLDWLFEAKNKGATVESFIEETMRRPKSSPTPYSQEKRLQEAQSRLAEIRKSIEHLRPRTEK